MIWGGEAVAVRPDGRANPRQLMINSNTLGGLEKLHSALLQEHQDRHGSTADLFVEQGYWRDLTTFTWNLHTAEGRGGIEDLVKGTHDTGNLAISEILIDRDAVIEDAVDGSSTDLFAFVTFETPVVTARGLIRLKNEGTEDAPVDKCWTLLTSAR